jgi:hypothetical protein
MIEIFYCDSCKVNQECRSKNWPTTYDIDGVVCDWYTGDREFTKLFAESLNVQVEHEPSPNGSIVAGGLLLFGAAAIWIAMPALLKIIATIGVAVCGAVLMYGGIAASAKPRGTPKKPTQIPRPFVPPPPRRGDE